MKCETIFLFRKCCYVYVYSIILENVHFNTSAPFFHVYVYTSVLLLIFNFFKNCWKNNSPHFRALEQQMMASKWVSKQKKAGKKFCLYEPKIIKKKHIKDMYRVIHMEEIIAILYWWPCIWLFYIPIFLEFLHLHIWLLLYTQTLI